jgi:hypothetical protein
MPGETQRAAYHPYLAVVTVVSLALCIPTTVIADVQQRTTDGATQAHPDDHKDPPLTDTKRQMTSDDLQHQGKQLRAAIEHTYQELSASNALKYDTPIDYVVLRYIPLDTSFNDAEQILRSAGFKVDPRPTTNPQGTRPDRYDVTASIVPFIDRFPSRTSIYVSMAPKLPGDYSTIARLSASIIVSLP